MLGVAPLGLEYLWKAAWSFYAEGDPGAESWVEEKATAILEGRAPRFEGQWRLHCLHTRQEQRRVHASRYLNELIPGTE